MNVLIFGGTGLLGSAAAQIFIDRGHKVKTIALPPLPEGALFLRKWISNSVTSLSLAMKSLKRQ